MPLISAQGVPPWFRSALREELEAESSSLTLSNHDLARLFALSSVVYAASMIRAETVAQVPFNVVSRQSGETLISHPLNVLLRDSPVFSDIALRSEWTMCFFGRNLVQKRRSLATRQVSSLRWVNPTLYTRDIDESLGPEGLIGFDLSSSSSRRSASYIERADAVYMNGLDFQDDWDGIAPAEAAFEQAMVDQEASLTVLSIFRNRAVPLSMVQPAANVPNAPDEPARKKLLALFRNALRGSRNAGKTIVTSGRWEVLTVQQNLEDMGFGEVLDQARIAVSIAFQIPLALLLPSGDGYAAAFQKDTGWVEKWLKPRCRWYATQYTRDLASEYGPDVSLEPDFSMVTTHDSRAVTEVTAAQVSSGLLDMYSGQQAIGNTHPDERLKDIYLINGQPTHVDVIVAMSRGSTSTEVPGTSPESLTLVTDNDQLPPRPEPLESRPEYRELRTASFVLERRGPGYAFQSREAPVGSIALLRLLMRTDTPQPEALRRAWWFAENVLIPSVRGYGNFESLYYQGLYDLVVKAFDRAVDRDSFGRQGRQLVSIHYRAAFLEGLSAGKVNVDELTASEEDTLRELVKAERHRWSELSAQLYKQVLPMWEQIETLKTRLKSETSPEMRAELKNEIVSKTTQFWLERDRFLGRLDMWSNSLRNVYHQGMTSARGNPMLTWRLGQTEKHCRTCLAAQGQRHRALTWEQYGLRPQGRNLECGGFHCDCRFEVTSEKAFGRIDRIPIVRSEGDHTHADDEGDNES